MVSDDEGEATVKPPAVVDPSVAHCNDKEDEASSTHGDLTNTSVVKRVLSAEEDESEGFVTESGESEGDEDVLDSFVIVVLESSLPAMAVLEEVSSKAGECICTAVLSLGRAGHNAIDPCLLDSDTAKADGDA